MPKRPVEPDAIERWKIFLRNHRHGIAAMDFFTVSTVTFNVLYILFVIHHARRKLLHFNVTAHPSAERVVQQLREAFPYETTPRYLIFDRDGKFGPSVVAAIKAMGIKPSRTAFRSPWQNGVAERWIGSVRREMLNHVVVLNERHMRRLLRDYVTYYLVDRTHIGLRKDSPMGRPASPKPSHKARIVSLPRIGGLHHRYEWREAA
jgi:transposase InsO family protein